jgi:exonuclease III
MSNKLRILQYNAHKSRKKVLIGLLQDLRVATYDIIAIQEPWRNRIDFAAYNPRSSPFHLVDAKEAGSRVSTYVNKNIPLSSWQETLHSNDLHTVTLRIASESQESRTINIHNVYNPPPKSHNEEEELGTLAVLPQASRMPGEHIFLGDFNLHHPLWAGPSYPHQHILADNLLEQMRNASAQLALPQNTITRDIQKGNSTEQTTIDLIFVTKILQDTILNCRVARELKQSSDHLPISTEFEWENVRETQEKRQRRAWKRLNKTKFAKSLAEGAEALKLLPLTTNKDINDYAKALTKAIRTAIDASTP